MKNRKKILSILGASLIGGGVVVAGVAQACATTTTPSPADAARLNTLVTAALSAISNIDTVPVVTNQLTLYNLIQDSIRIIFDDTTAVISVMNLGDITGSVAENGESITITAGQIRIFTNSTVGSSVDRIGVANVTDDLTISGLTLSENRNAIVATNATVSGLAAFGQSYYQNLIRTGLNELNNATSTNPIATAILAQLPNLAEDRNGNAIPAINIQTVALAEITSDIIVQPNNTSTPENNVYQITVNTITFTSITATLDGNDLVLGNGTGEVAFILFISQITSVSLNGLSTAGNGILSFVPA